MKLFMQCTIAVLTLSWIGPAFAANKGVNISGGEYNSSKTRYGYDYIYPDLKTLTYYASKKMVLIRVPFRWIRVQPNAFGPLNATEIARLKKVVADAKSLKMRVILDAHDYASYKGVKLTYTAQTIVNKTQYLPLSDFWSKMALEFKYEPDAVLFGLMNEPSGGPSAMEWKNIAQDAVYAIRKTGAKNAILVPGTRWTGAHSWFAKDKFGVSNASALQTMKDPGKRLVFEMHQYLDSDSSGTHAACKSETIGVDRLKAATQWLKDNKFRGFLGEFGVANNPTCLKALENMVAYMEANKVWWGWAYWAGGAWIPQYMYSVQPDKTGAEKPQMAVLKKFTKAR